MSSYPYLADAETQVIGEWLLGCRDYFASRRPNVAAWANDSLIELLDGQRAHYLEFQALVRPLVDEQGFTVLESRFEEDDSQN